MRQVLVDYARQRYRKKRRPQGERVPLDSAIIAVERPSLDITDLDEALDQLEREDGFATRVVVLHFFGGLTFREIAGLLKVSQSTVKREWDYARCWLYRRLEEGQRAEEGQDNGEGPVPGSD